MERQLDILRQEQDATIAAQLQGEDADKDEEENGTLDEVHRGEGDLNVDTRGESGVEGEKGEVEEKEAAMPEEKDSSTDTTGLGRERDRVRIGGDEEEDDETIVPKDRRRIRGIRKTWFDRMVSVSSLEAIRKTWFNRMVRVSSLKAIRKTWFDRMVRVSSLEAI